MVYHFIGIGGIGMSALATLALQKGYRVQGSDSSYNDRCKELEQKGAFIQKLPHSVQEKITVVYSSAINEDHPEMQTAKALGMPLLHRSQLLEQFMQEKKSIVVAGSHGKTTTSALLVHLLKECGDDPTYSIGGIILPNKGNAAYGSSPYFIAEGDESDGSFLHTDPKYALVTSSGDDHLEYWQTQEKLDEAFETFVSKAKDLFYNADDPKLRKIVTKGTSVGFSTEAICQITDCTHKKMHSFFSLSFPEKKIRDLSLPLIGKHNIANAALAVALCLHLGFEEKKIRKALLSFKGIKRRMEKITSVKGIDAFTDYAHHPKAVQTTLEGVKKAFPQRRLVVLFQPHRYSRLHKLWHEFTSSFSLADHTIITDVDPVNEKVDPKRGGKELAAEMDTPYIPFDKLKLKLHEHLQIHDILLVMGAGSINKTCVFLPSILQKVKKLQLGLFFGGKSPEYEISCRSASVVAQNLDKDLYEVKQFPLDKKGKSADLLSSALEIDLALPVFHGPDGEDGMIQGFLDTLQIPYVGCDYKSSAIAMHKAWAKSVVKQIDLPTCDFISITHHDWKENKKDLLSKIEKELPFPLWVKGVHLGSSIGIKRVVSFSHLQKSIDEVFTHDYTLIIEEEMACRQIEYSLMGNDEIEAALPAEIITDKTLYDYEGKYGKNPDEVKVPARIPHEWRKKGEEYAKKIYRALQCSGLSRIDFFLDEWGEFWFNEINPMPGLVFGEKSPYAKMWARSGKPLNTLLNELIMLAMKKRVAAR